MTKFWLGFFAVWILFLSGVLTPFTHTPGILQALRLHSHLKQQKETLAKMDARMELLEADRKKLESSSTAQEREIRKVLGYVAPNELIFDLRPLPARTKN